jgi:hypothetical protein
MAMVDSPSGPALSSGPVNVILSRDELALVLSLLQAQTIPGLDPDPLGQRTPEQQDAAFVAAARGLRARGLARARPADQPDAAPLAIHAGVLAAVSACAFSTGALFVYHWPSGAELPLRLYGHLRDSAFVIHTPYEDVLHRLAVLASREDLVGQALAVCQLRQQPAAATDELRLAGSDFSQLRQLAEQGNLIQARALLNPAVAPADLINALLATLASQPQVTIVQALKSAEGSAAAKRDLTLVQGSNALWLVAAVDGDASLLTARQVTRSDVVALLLQSL